MSNGKDLFNHLIQSNLSTSCLLAAAAWDGDIEAVESLLQNGVSVNAKNRFDDTALLVAALKGHTNIARLLLEKHAALDEKNKYGHTALIMAACNNHKDIVRLLLDAGAALDIRDHDNRTALDWACKHMRKEIEQMLREEVNRRDQQREQKIRENVAKKTARLRFYRPDPSKIFRK